MPNWQGLVSIYDEWIAVLFIFPAAERLRSTSCLNGKITVGHRFAIIANYYFPLSKALGVAGSTYAP
jgi:hypothetical protein